MRRALAGLLLTVLIGGPMAASVCEASCLDHDHGYSQEPTVAPEHQHHHVSVAEEPSSRERPGLSSTEGYATADLTIVDCCVDQSHAETINVRSATPSAASSAPVAIAPWALADRPRLSARCAVAHALEPPPDSVARHLSAILRT